jgi:outer membrane protein assembly factor BamE (lipoprotein component of BamABCDE complex)
MSPNLVKQGSSFKPNQPMPKNYKQKELGGPADCFNRLPLARSGSILRSVSRFVLVLLLVLGVSCSGKRITKSNVDQVTEGMSKKQVESILGSPTSLTTEDFVIMKKTTYVYRQGKDTVTIVFKDDKVQSKDSTLSD